MINKIIITLVLFFLALQIAKAQCPSSEYATATSFAANITNTNSILGPANNQFTVFNNNNSQLVVHLANPVLAGTRITIRLRRNTNNAGLLIYSSDEETAGYNNLVQYTSTNTPLGSTFDVTYTASRTIEYLLFRGNSSTGSSFSVDAISYCMININVTNTTVVEEVGNAIFDVTYSGANTSAFTFNYSTAEGSALNGIDFTNTPGSLSFSGASGQTLQITVPIINDEYGENTEDFTINFSNVSGGATLNTKTATITITDNDVPIPNNTPLVLMDEFNGYYDYSTTGGSLRTGDNSNACAITTLSSNTLLSPIPTGAVIDKAYLYWSHSSQVPDDNVIFEGVNVKASKIYGSALSFNGANLQFYGYVADVTSLVENIASPSTNVFDFSGLTIDNGGDYCATSTVMGGWSMMVFYQESSLPAVTINLYEGYKGDSGANYPSGIATSTFTLSGFYSIGSLGAKTTVLSWEGDDTLANNESLTFSTPSSGANRLVGDGDNDGVTKNNPFNSTIFDNTVFPVVNNSTSYGLDLDTFDVSTFIGVGESSATTTVNVGQDYVIMNAVLLKVPSNIITGKVYEDINYGGGVGRSLATSSGELIEGVTVELYNSSNTLVDIATTDDQGQYVFGGMANGNYLVRVVNATVKSTRDNGITCSDCFGVPTYRSDFGTITGFTSVDRIGGLNPSIPDSGEGTLNNAKTVSTVNISNEGIVGLNFGFNFNTIVNTNEDGQGSLNQFIINSNTLGETNLDILPNSIFDPISGEDISIFMIPPVGDVQGRTADTNYASGIFDIFIPNAKSLAVITDNNTSIDGRTQTAYSGDTNIGTTGSGGSSVGVSANTLTTFVNPEIQIHRNAGDVIRIQALNTVIRNVSIYANNNAGIRINSGDALVAENLIGVNAQGNNSGNIDYGVEVVGGEIVIRDNYIATTSDAGILINGGASTLIQGNQITTNGTGTCFDNIKIQNGSGINITGNLIEKAGALGIDASGYVGNLMINENTITNSGQNGGLCSGVIENAGIKLDGDNSQISKNIIASNGGSGIVISGGATSGNLISQNSIFANGTAANALGIDLDASNALGDGVTINDAADADSGPNGLLNFPIIANAFVSGPNLVIEGWSRPGATIEIFLTDINEGSAITGDNQLGYTTDYGEGQIYLATVVEGSAADVSAAVSPYTDVDGNTDTTNKFKFVITGPLTIAAGNFITSTATISNSTSEFSPFSIIKNYTVITNRRITYRVKTN
ncbi:right-handed parallel beta-helix repeat-containing protein [Cellulophaga sp. HaHa_2_95]|uniref:beta strand repeat-containing protein n=1 Tax=Cellulophaga sp. HaHa_2_95 TaxID=2745558 RepID=UPI001C4E7EA3|nr:right-handed parallel beta-helix repeat-containing protein [Cellulophaga sp. HaHa_2_95]QXP55801.1 right-handed parallel beta-helix repeat-containing protein [Cellulophaga sp. HaHa_2_95]